MSYHISEEIIQNTILCRYNYDCLFSEAILPQCNTICEKGGDCITVKEKGYYLGICPYHLNINGKNGDDSAICFCPVRVEIFRKYGK